MMTEMVRIASALGFLKIYSRHRASNNAVLIPKLKAGFVITSFEISDFFGTTVQLSYFTNELRRKAYEYRVGAYPDEELSEALKLSQR